MNDTDGSLEEVTMVPAVSGRCGGRGVSGDPSAGWLLSSVGQTTPRYGSSAAEYLSWRCEWGRPARAARPSHKRACTVAAPDPA
jgi:hypothetical protein